MGMDQRQVQVQKLAPRMIQSMEILQLPMMALEERIEQEMTENPTLEMRDNDPELPDERDERENPNETRRPREGTGRRRKGRPSATTSSGCWISTAKSPIILTRCPAARPIAWPTKWSGEHDAMANLAERPEIAAGLPDRSTGRVGL